MGPGDRIYVAAERRGREIVLACRFRRQLAGAIFEVVAPAIDEGDDEVQLLSVPQSSTQTQLRVDQELSVLELPGDFDYQAWVDELASDTAGQTAEEEETGRAPPRKLPAAARALNVGNQHDEMAEMRDMVRGLTLNVRDLARDVRSLKPAAPEDLPHPVTRPEPTRRGTSAGRGLDGLMRLYHGADDADGEEDGAEALGAPTPAETNWAGALTDRMAQATASGPRRDLPPRTPGPSTAQPQLPMSTMEALVSSMAETQRTTGMALQAISRRGRAEGIEEDDDGEGLEAGVGKFAYPSRLRHLIDRKPEVIINNWMRVVKEKCGATQPGMSYGLTIHADRLRKSFGHHTSLLRAHYYIAAALDRIILQGEILPGVAMAINAMRAIHQAALDNGKWDTANLMVSTPDPLETIQFAGEPDEMGRIAAYQDAFLKLKAKRPMGGPPSKWGGQQHDDGAEEHHAPMPKYANAKWKAKAKAPAAP